MTELERALVRLGADLAFPETPDVAAAARDRLAETTSAGRRPGARALVAAFAILAVAVGAAMAVPAARTAILELFGLRGATVQRVDVLPEVPDSTATALALGRPVPLESGRPRVELPVVLVLEALGPPAEAYVAETVFGPKLSLVYEPGEGLPRSRHTGVGLLVTQFRGDLDPGYIDKLAAGGTAIVRLAVDGDPAIWLGGGAHVVTFRAEDGVVAEDVVRLAGNTLLVQHGNLLVRIEGEIGRERAVEIAESLVER